MICTDAVLASTEFAKPLRRMRMRKPKSGASESDARPFRQRLFADKTEAEVFLSGIADSISEAQFDGDAGEFFLSYAGGSLGHSDLHRGNHSKLSFRITRADEYHIVLPLTHGARFTGRTGTIEVVAGRTGILLPPRLEGRFDVQAGTSGFSLIASVTSVAVRAGELIGSDGGLGSPRGAPVVLDHADPIVKTLVRNVSNVFHEMQNCSGYRAFTTCLVEFRRSAVELCQRADLAFGTKPSGGQGCRPRSRHRAARSRLHRRACRRAHSTCRPGAGARCRPAVAAEWLPSSCRMLAARVSHELPLTARAVAPACSYFDHEGIHGGLRLRVRRPGPVFGQVPAGVRRAAFRDVAPSLKFVGQSPDQIRQPE